MSMKDIPEELTLKFKKNFIDKTLRLQTLHLKLKKSFELKHFQEFSSIIHKIAGTAGIYGYQEISLYCKEVEKKLINDTYNPLLIEEVSNYLVKVKL